MYELIKTSLDVYVFLAVYTGLVFSAIIIGIIKKTKDIESEKLKIFSRLGISVILVCFYLWFFIYVNLYPISLAYYEYDNNVTLEKIGVVESIELNGKDRINIIIDSTEYTMVHSSLEPYLGIGGVDEGDTVNFIFGEKSKFIFEISEESEKN